MKNIEVMSKGIAEAEVGTPPNDGSAGSALYVVPIVLSENVPHEWGRLFEAIWKQHPFRFRSGILVGSNRIYFEKTRIEEVKENKEQIKEAVAETNRRYNEWLEEKERREHAEAKKAAEDRKKREDEAKDTNRDW